MTDPRTRLPVAPPTVAPPPLFTERRVAHRRAEDRRAHVERALLARALDVLASDRPAEARLAGLLDLLARTAGARRTAVVADGIERRVAVAVAEDEDRETAEALASWLDARAGRSRSRRAAAGPAPVSFVVGSPAPAGEPADRRIPATDAPRVYAMLPIPSAGEVVLGFEFGRARDAERLAERIPPQLARHAAVALALVTEQLATERELAVLRARDAERTTFVSTVAHELRTPLTGLRGYLELILDGDVADPVVQREFLERSRGIVGSMGDLVGDLLELARLESGTVSIEIGPFSVAEAGDAVVAALHPIALDRSVALLGVPPPRMRAALGDRRRVEQVLTNLTANALKFTPAGGAVEVEGRFEGSVALLVVRDDGAGIPAEDRARIFERFHRMAGHERITGTGLGLPIARDLARRMDGDLGVASVVGAGSAFVLALPGPAGVDPATLAATLAAALIDEERGLEERSILRKLGAASRPAPEPAEGRANRPPRAARNGSRAQRSTRLRALAGLPAPDARTA